MRLNKVTMILICLLGCMGMFVADRLLARKSLMPPLSIQFIGYTNYTGERFATFRVTNQSAVQQQFSAFGQTSHNSRDDWLEEFNAVSESFDNGPYWTYLSPGKSTRFSILVFGPDKPYRLSLKLAQHDSKWRQWRRGWSEWCLLHNLPHISQIIYKAQNDLIIFGPEVQSD
jgi:hypothetical protein